MATVLYMNGKKEITKAAEGDLSKFSFTNCFEVRAYGNEKKSK